ncbi:ADP-ribosylation [Daldinia decipiens]|uniref:ADP-ribosylation n=1 Tax=Daldinia decipiens TaxID=326647 RepID=UPI0020C2BE2F|nr:ADP-ribosylation [Daldinia decipiens]KAI1652624.1 ADP-ribosylation [Daldinia decipiens]
MFGRSYFTSFVSFLALLGPAATTELYRMDFRPPVQVKNDGGLLSRNPEGDGSVIDHVKNTLGDDDPWVSTTTDYNVAKGGATSPGNVYVYYIDPSGLDAVDTLIAFQEAGEPHPHPGEKEISIKSSVPWDHITKWDTFKRSKKTATTTREEFEQSQGGSAKGRSIRSFVA